MESYTHYQVTVCSVLIFIMAFLLTLAAEALAIGIEELVGTASVAAVEGIGESIGEGAIEEFLLDSGFESINNTQVSHYITKIVKEGASAAVKFAATETSKIATNEIKKAVKRSSDSDSDESVKKLKASEPTEDETEEE